MTLRLGIDGKCQHDHYHCSIVTHPGPYMVTRAVKHPAEDFEIPEFIRWSTPDDPPFPCLCACEACCAWRALREQIDGPIVLPAS